MLPSKKDCTQIGKKKKKVELSQAQRKISVLFRIYCYHFWIDTSDYLCSFSWKFIKSPEFSFNKCLAVIRDFSQLKRLESEKEWGKKWIFLICTYYLSRKTWGNFHSYRTSIGKIKRTDTNCFAIAARAG